MNGILRWLIDERLFAGNPLLTLGPVQAGAGTTGYGFVGGFGLQVWKHGSIWHAHGYSLSIGSFNAHLILEQWLDGKQQATSPVKLDATVCQLGRLIISGDGRGSFSPNWLLNFTGSGLFALDGL